MKNIIFIIIFLFSTKVVFSAENWKDFYFESQKFSRENQYVSAYQSAKKAVRLSKSIFFNSKNNDYALALSNLGGYV
jgi:hypothetical protein